MSFLRCYFGAARMRAAPLRFRAAYYAFDIFLSLLFITDYDMIFFFFRLLVSHYASSLLFSHCLSLIIY